MSSAAISRRRNLQNGTILIANQAAQLVNFPLAQEVARHVHKLVVAIKPDILQAPKDNDMSARKLAARIGKLIDFLDEAADETGSDVNIPDSAVEYLLELEQLRSDLRCSLSELQGICGLGYPTKFASQSRIQGSIQNTKEQLMQAKVDVLTSLTMFTVSGPFRQSARVSQPHDAQCLKLVAAYYGNAKHTDPIADSARLSAVGRLPRDPAPEAGTSRATEYRGATSAADRLA